MKCSVYIAVSLDGFIARADGGLDWLNAVQRDGEDYGYSKFAKTIDVLVMGRGTYETALGFGGWPYEGKRVVVLTHQNRESKYGETFFSGDVRELVAQLKREGCQRAYVDGGAVVREFFAADLIDDLTLSVIPVVLGTGIRLFNEEVPERALRLESSRAFDSGLVQLTYSVARNTKAANP